MRKVSQESLADIHASLIGWSGASSPPLAAREAVLDTITISEKGGGMGVGGRLMASARQNHPKCLG